MISLPSFTFVPGWLYMLLFNVLILMLVMTATVQAAKGTIYQWNAAKGTRFLAFLFVIFIILYIGLRPTISVREYPYFADTYNYKADIYHIKARMSDEWLPDIDTGTEWLWNIITAFCAAFADEHLMFLIASSVYVSSSALFCLRIFRTQWFVPFLMICAAFTFFSYGVNGVRNGMAASMVILALSYRNKLWIAILLCFLAMGIHKSMALMITASVLAWKITNPRLYIAGWLVCIVVTAVAGSMLSTVIANAGFFDDSRLAGYGVRNLSSGAYFTGFRLDFLLYSALPIISGGYFIFKKLYRDPFYLWLYNIYIVCNAFWLLMMYAAFSNRFAQLSWFIMPIVCMYPWFKERFWKHQETQLASFLLICYAYTFYSHFVSAYLA